MQELTVVKEFTFDSSHTLPDYDGPCGRLHGHTYRLQIGMQGCVNPQSGMVIDFKDIKQIVKTEIIEPLDHYDLNSIKGLPNFPCSNPTAENIVLWIIGILGTNPATRSLSFVRLWETPNSFVEWRSK